MKKIAITWLNFIPIYGLIKYWNQTEWKHTGFEVTNSLLIYACFGIFQYVCLISLVILGFNQFQ